MRFERVWRKTFQWCTRRSFSRTSRACLWSWKNSSWYKHAHMPEWGIDTTADFTSCLSKHRILVGFEPTHTYIQAQRCACYYTLHTHIFSLSLAQTLTHTQGLGTSRLVALTHFLCFEAASGEMAFPIIAFEACVRRRLCVYMFWGKGGTDINSL